MRVGDIVKFRPDATKVYVPPAHLTYRVLRAEPVRRTDGSSIEMALIQYLPTLNDRFTAGNQWTPSADLEPA